MLCVSFLPREIKPGEETVWVMFPQASFSSVPPWSAKSSTCPGHSAFTDSLCLRERSRGQGHRRHLPVPPAAMRKAWRNGPVRREGRRPTDKLPRPAWLPSGSSWNLEQSGLPIFKASCCVKRGLLGACEHPYRLWPCHRPDAQRGRWSAVALPCQSPAWSEGLLWRKSCKLQLSSRNNRLATDSTIRED